MDQAGLEQFYADLNNLNAGAGVSFTPQGSAMLTLGADGAFTWAPDAQVTADVAGTTVLISIGGQLGGSYTATADHISTDTASVDGLTISATIDGVEIDPGEVTEVIASAPIADSAFTCSADTLTLVSQVADASATSVLHRH